MKSINVLDGLAPKDRLALARWYDTDVYRALVKLIELERLHLAKDHVDQLDIMQVRYLSGQAAGLKKLVGTLKTNYKETDKGKL